MTQRAILILAILALSGCTGIPAGTPSVGDTVTVNWVAFDAATGERLDGGNRLSFAVGSGKSGLGFGFEHGVIGQAKDETFRFRSDDPSRDFRQKVEVVSTIETPITGTAPRSAFEQQIGPAVTGQSYPFGFYELLATNVTSSQVSYRYIVEDGQRDPLPSLGATLVTTTRGDTLVQHLEPTPGATFLIQANFLGETPLNLQPGSYRTIGSHGEHIVYAFSPVTRSTLVGVVVDFEVTITSIQPAAPLPPGDNFGVRRSPQLLADPATLQPAAADDGHAGHSH